MTDEEIRKKFELTAMRNRSEQRAQARQQRIQDLQAPQSEGAGRAGGVKGFALDILPFGRVAEKAINPNAGKITGGEILTEGLLTALPFGLGRIGKAVKGGKAAISAARSGQKGPDAASILKSAGSTSPATPAAARSSSAERLFSRQRGADTLTAKGSGLQVGQQLGGTRGVEDAVSVFQRHGITGAPKTQLKKIDQKIMPQLSQQVDEALQRSPVPLSGQNVRGRVQEAINDPLKYAELDLGLPGVQKNLGTHLKKFESATSAKELNDYIKTLNPIAIRAQDKLVRGVGLTDKETSALAAKKAGDEVLSEIPEIAPLKKDMAILFDRYGDVSKQVGKKSNIPIVGGMLGSAPGDIAKSVQSRLGARMSGSPAAQRNLGMAGQAARILAPQAGVRAGADVFGARGDTNMFGSPGETGVPAPSTDAASLLGGVQTTGELPEPQVDETQQRIQMFMQGAERAAMAGDLDASEQLMGMAEQLSAIRETQGPEVPEANEKTDAAITTLNQVEQLFNQAGGGQGLLGYGQKLAGKARLNPEVEAYDNVRKSAAVQLARAFGEVGALSNQDIEMYAKMLPDSTSTPEAAAIQFNSLKERLAAGSTSGSGAASSILSRLGY